MTLWLHILMIKRGTTAVYEIKPGGNYKIFRPVLPKTPIPKLFMVLLQYLEV